MKHSKIMIALAALLLLATVPFVAAQQNGPQYNHSNGVATVTTDNLGLKVTAANQVPHFHFWDANDSTPGTDYHVMFSKFFEANDTDDDGTYTPGTDSRVYDPLVLPSLGWEFSGFETEGDPIDMIHFNFTSTETFTPGGPPTLADNGPPASMDITIKILVHIDLANDNEMKFDIMLDGWDWTYDDSILVFQFIVSESQHGEENGTAEPTSFQQEGATFNFGEAYMEVAQTAVAGNESSPQTVQVRASHGSSAAEETGESVYISFENFGNESLYYDPTLGIGSDGLGIIDYNQLLLIGVGVTVVVLIAIAFKMRK
ncbi:MAG: conserved exported protein of unknown function [Candidatus Thorarchaeota archaeon]|nr:MAG: conserved exported protein of unknown function [Candidatus Thorarchaeota archaeon]